MNRPQVRFVTRKYDGSPHWEHPSLVLGEDDTGIWLGQRHGWYSERPGARFTPQRVSVTVLPRGGSWVATFFPPSSEGVRTYVDIVAELDLHALTTIDMDLDVILASDGQHGDRLWIDDEDEFEEHRVAFGYPPELVERCLSDAQRVLELIRDQAPPFDGRADRWLADADHGSGPSD